MRKTLPGLGTAREAAGVSMYKLSEELGVDVATVWRHEHQHSTVSLEQAEHYARLLDCTIQDLFGE